MAFSKFYNNTLTINRALIICFIFPFCFTVTNKIQCDDNKRAVLFLGVSAGPAFNIDRIISPVVGSHISFTPVFNRNTFGAYPNIGLEYLHDFILEINKASIYMRMFALELGPISEFDSNHAKLGLRLGFVPEPISFIFTENSMEKMDKGRFLLVTPFLRAYCVWDIIDESRAYFTVSTGFIISYQLLSKVSREEE